MVCDRVERTLHIFIYSAKLFFPTLLLLFPTACSVTPDSTASHPPANSESVVSFIIKIEKSGGDIWGKAPRFSVEIDPYGKMVFDGIENTLTKGKVEINLDPKQRNDLEDLVKTSDFFLLKDSYSSRDDCPVIGTDGANIRITILLNDTQKTILHNTTCMEKGADGKAYPPQLVQLEERFSEILELERYAGKSAL